MGQPWSRSVREPAVAGALTPSSEYPPSPLDPPSPTIPDNNENFSASDQRLGLPKVRAKDGLILEEQSYPVLPWSSRCAPLTRASPHDGGNSRAAELHNSEDNKENMLSLPDLEGAQVTPVPLICSAEKEAVDSVEDKREHEKTQSPGKLRRLLKRRHSTKVSPEVLKDVSKDLINPPTPKDLLPQANTASSGNPTITDSNKNHKGLVDEPITPVPMSEISDVDEGFISVTQLYNSMNDGQLSPYLFDPTYILMIDTRSWDQYQEMHISTARHVQDLDNPKLVEPLTTYTLIVIYDAEGCMHGCSDSVLCKTVKRIQSVGQEPFVLQGGYTAFASKHPYLCTEKFIYTERERQMLIVNYPSIILDNQLYLGRGDQACKSKIIRDLGLTHVINITREHPNAFPEKLQYLNIQLDDDNSSNLMKEFSTTTKFIQDAISSGGRVMIHCNLGVSRSSTIVIAYLMSTRHWTLRDAHHFVKEHRPVVRPNRGFFGQLSGYEEELFGKRYTQIDDWLLR